LIGSSRDLKNLFFGIQGLESSPEFTNHFGPPLVPSIFFRVSFQQRSKAHVVFAIGPSKFAFFARCMTSHREIRKPHSKDATPLTALAATPPPKRVMFNVFFSRAPGSFLGRGSLPLAPGPKGEPLLWLYPEPFFAPSFVRKIYRKVLLLRSSSGSTRPDVACFFQCLVVFLSYQGDFSNSLLMRARTMRLRRRSSSSFFSTCPLSLISLARPDF